MQRFLKKILIGICILSLVLGLGYYKYKAMYPYGNTHRCSKGFAFELRMFADEKGGRYPNFVDGDKLMIAGYMDFMGDDDSCLELIIGKTGDFEESKRFYHEHGYLLSSHSAWQFVNGVKSAHDGRAFAWDKIPLGHNGQVQACNSREVIEVGSMVNNVPESAWAEYLERQESVNWED